MCEGRLVVRQAECWSCVIVNIHDFYARRSYTYHAIRTSRLPLWSCPHCLGVVATAASLASLHGRGIGLYGREGVGVVISCSRVSVIDRREEVKDGGKGFGDK